MTERREYAIKILEQATGEVAAAAALLKDDRLWHQARSLEGHLERIKDGK